jgi:hypothetical protein
MMYNTELIGFWTLSSVRYSKEHSFGNLIFLRRRVRVWVASTLLGPLERANFSYMTQISWTQSLRFQLFTCFYDDTEL